MKKIMFDDSNKESSLGAMIRDLLPSRIKEDLLNHNYTFEVFDFEKDQEGRSYAVFSINALEHAENWIQALESIVRACEQYALILLPFDRLNGSKSNCVEQLFRRRCGNDKNVPQKESGNYAIHDYLIMEYNNLQSVDKRRQFLFEP